MSYLIITNVALFYNLLRFIGHWFDVYGRATPKQLRRQEPRPSNGSLQSKTSFICHLNFRIACYSLIIQIKISNEKYNAAPYCSISYFFTIYRKVVKPL